MQNPPILPLRLRKFIGMILIVVLVFFYAIVVAALGASTWMPSNKFIEFVFYLVAGMGWAVPAAVIIWWMQRPDASDDA